MAKNDIKEKPSWIFYVKAFGAFLIGYCAIEAGHEYLVDGWQNTSFAYYGGLVVFGFVVFIISLICEKRWEKPLIKSPS
jgi:uncharacterized membrane protein YcjF (UPF0283 family)